MIIGPCTIVTGGPEPQVLEDAAVRVVGAHISHIGFAGNLAAAYPEETLWPARGRVLMPGFVDAHAHLARHLARGLALRTPAEWSRYDRALSTEDVRWAVTAALVESVRHGVTTVCDFHRSSGCLDLSLSEVMDAAQKVGVRLAACYGAAEEDAPVDRKAAFEESVAFAGEVARRRDGRFRGLVGFQARTTAGVESMLAGALEAANGSLALHVDLGLDLTPAERWRAPGAWPESAQPALWAHAEAAPRELVGRVCDRGDAWSATGPAVGAARDVEVAWGSDAGVHAPPLGELTPGRASQHYRRVFVAGARWAERHFGLGLGTVSPGAPADLLLVDYRPATEFSARTLAGHLDSGLLRAPVSGVLVAGEIVMDGGQLLTVDEREVALRARECAARVWERLG